MGSTRQGEFSQRPCCEHDAGTGSLPVPDLNFWSLATPPDTEHESSGAGQGPTVQVHTGARPTDPANTFHDIEVTEP